MIHSKDLGCMTNMAVLQQLISLEGQFVIDAGCGSMVFTRILSDLGARVLAIDPDPIQADLNRRADPIPNVEFVETGAEHYPVEPHTVDGLFFSYSLHHIPKQLYPKLFDEILRVLKPGGFLYVLEPMACPLNDVMKLFHNEEQERSDAQQALIELGMPAFSTAEAVTYHNLVQYDSFEDFAQQFASRTFNPGYTESDVRRPEVEAAFEHHGKPDYQFESPKKVILMRLE